MPIGCGGVAVYPGDVIVGDDEGVVVIPQHLADEVARIEWQTTGDAETFARETKARVDAVQVSPATQQTQAEIDEIILLSAALDDRRWVPPR